MTDSTQNQRPSNGFVSVGYARIADEYTITANVMIPAHLVFSKSIAALKPDEVQEVYLRKFIGDGQSELEQFGTVSLSKSGRGLNIRLRNGNLLTMSATQVKNLVDPNYRIQTATVSAPDEPWMPTVGGGSRR